MLRVGIRSEGHAEGYLILHLVVVAQTSFIIKRRGLAPARRLLDPYN